MWGAGLLWELASSDAIPCACLCFYLNLIVRFTVRTGKGSLYWIICCPDLQWNISECCWQPDVLNIANLIGAKISRYSDLYDYFFLCANLFTEGNISAPLKKHALDLNFTLDGGTTEWLQFLDLKIKNSAWCLENSFEIRSEIVSYRPPS